ncbi:alcohol dehydrogenase catalytic domain-containing protein [Streptomyces sp. NPDC127072]|uniref:alcohol dehydrogenase catalytic domain-containing protein n=1 Tax=Streptomyces sp. NPDC127072 TaxID=3347129 RepID=UPI00365D72AF
MNSPTTTSASATTRTLIGGRGADRNLEEAALPSQLGVNRIQVQAAGLNRPDLYDLEGPCTATSQSEGPFTAGMEVAGVVEAGSPPSRHLPAGARVMGITTGVFAHFALAWPI